MRTQLNSIQYLRAIAAILVAYSHSIDLQMNYSGAHSFQQDFVYLQNFGAFGVDLFFVISGFIISYSAERYKGIRDGSTFLRHRFRRLNPVYYIVTLLYILMSVHARLRDHVPFLNGQKLVKSIFLLPLLDRTKFIDCILFQAWTLSFEWFFYLLFLVTILAGTRHKQRYLTIMMIGLVATGLFLHGGDYRLHFISNPILLEFMLGGIIYWCYSRSTIRTTGALALLLAGIAICIYGIIKGFGDIDGASGIFSGRLSFMRLLYWGIPAGLLVAGSVFLEKKGIPGFARNRRLLALLGDSSYSIYLINTLVFETIAWGYRRTGFFLNPDLAIFLQLAVAIFAGVLFYKWVEAPLLRRLRKKNPSYSISTTLPR
ncbi:MAG TPA: acyltransferase [Puia sp.]